MQGAPLGESGREVGCIHSTGCPGLQATDDLLLTYCVSSLHQYQRDAKVQIVTTAIRTRYRERGRRD